MRKVMLTNHFIVITESRCRRRVGRTVVAQSRFKETGVGRLTLLGKVRRIRDLRQAGHEPGLSFLFFITRVFLTRIF